MKKTIEANALEDANVQFISLVKRGANRVPFRIIKSEENKTMTIDLSSIFKREAVVPAVTAIFVNKSADLDKAKAIITAAGYSVEKMEENDGGFVFKQDDFEGNVSVIKFSESLAIGVSHVEKMFNEFNFESTSFKDMMSQEGFWPSMYVAKDTLSATISNIMHKAEDSGEAAENIKKAINDFRSYTVALVSAMPVKAFKLEVSSETADGPEGVAKAADSGDTGNDEGSSQDGDTEQKTDDGQSEDGKTNKSDGAGSEESTSSEESSEKKGDTDDDGNKGGTELSKTDSDKLLAGVQALIEKSAQATLAAVDEVKKGVSDLSARVDDVEAVAKKADEAVSGTVAGTDSGEDSTTYAKGESEKAAPPLIDTGYMDITEDD